MVQEEEQVDVWVISYRLQADVFWDKKWWSTMSGLKSMSKDGSQHNSDMNQHGFLLYNRRLSAVLFRDH